MGKPASRNSWVIVLAYAHRYVYPLAIVGLSILLDKEYLPLALGIGCILFAVYTLVGYICRWKHIYCSYQNAYHQKMTPNDIRWHTVKKTDAYGVPVIFGILGLFSIVAYFFC